MRQVLRPLIFALVFLLPATAAVFLAVEGLRLRPPVAPLLPQQDETLVRAEVGNVAEAEALFQRLGYAWPPAVGPSVPRIALDPLPADYPAGLETRRKKALFFRALLPLVLAENRVLRAQRQHLLRLRELGLPAQAGTASHAWLQDLLRRYRVSQEDGLAPAVERLLQRLDEIPPALVLAQAANESAWGTSRFARIANNLFGQWTWQEEHGIVPAERPEGERYLVRKFPSLRASVRDYLYNLNVGHAYEALRRMRHEMRAAGEALDAMALASGLSRYSERGEDYVEEIRRIIRGNRLDRLGDVDLMPAEDTRRLALLLDRFSDGDG